MKNLIREHNILSTRSSIYTKEDKFADYIFTDPSVHVNQFSVLKDEVSDHLPLYIDFE
jgi:endonuclease/exonuclease/phosphatase family metal-dependent hydrolase